MLIVRDSMVTPQRQTLTSFAGPGAPIRLLRPRLESLDDQQIRRDRGKRTRGGSRGVPNAAQG